MIIIDIETSGLDPNEYGLLSVGAVDFLHPKEQFYGECRIRQGEKYDQSALDINGFTPEEIKSRDKISTRDLLKNFDTWLQKRPEKVLGGMHIAAFDIPFLQAKAQQCDVSLKLHRRSIDLLSIAYSRMLSQKKVVPLTDGWTVVDTDVIYPFCGLPHEPQPRTSINGAKWEAESLARLTYGKGIFRSFARYEVPEYLKH